MRRLLLVSVLALVVLVARVAAAAPGEVTGNSEDTGDRTLRGHTFPAPLSMPSAFVTTHFGIRQGVTLVSVPRLPVAGSSYELKLTGLVQNVDLGVRLTDWLGLFWAGNGRVITGVNVPSLLLAENSFSLEGQLGALVRVVRIPTTGTQVAVRVDAGLGTGRILSVANLLTNALESTRPTFDTVLKGGLGQYLLVRQSSFAFGTSALAAQAVTQNLGLQASLEGRRTSDTRSPYVGTVGDYVDQTTTTTSVSAGIAASLDGAPNGIPLALQPEYKLVAAFATDADGARGSAVQHLVGVGLYYSGRRDLQVGVGGAMQLGLDAVQGEDGNHQPVSSGRPVVQYGQFILRYVW